MKRNLLITLTSTIVGVLASLVIYDIYKSKVQNNLDDKSLKVSGKPGQTEDLDELDKMNNAEMVAEGSQFGVQYYDKYKNVELTLINTRIDQLSVFFSFCFTLYYFMLRLTFS